MKQPRFWHWSMRSRMLLLFYMLVLLLLGCAWLIHTYPQRTDRAYTDLIGSQQTVARMTGVSVAVQNFRLMLLRATLFTALSPRADQSQFLDDLRIAQQNLQVTLGAV